METVKLAIELPKELYDKLDKPIGDEVWLRYIIRRGTLLTQESETEDTDSISRKSIETRVNLNFNSYQNITKHAILDIIHTEPSIVSKGLCRTMVSRGTWVKRKKWDMYVCSKCSHETEVVSKFCPNCGASMLEDT